MNKIKIFFVFFAVLLIAGCKQSDRDFNNSFFIIKKAKKNKDFNVAINEYYKLWSLDTNNINHLDSIASLYFESGDCVKTLNALDHIFEFRADDSNIQKALKCALNLNLMDEAENYLITLTHASKDSILWMHKLGNFYFETNQMQESMVTFENLMKINGVDTFNVDLTFNEQSLKVPLLADTYNKYGVLLVKLNHNDKAATYFEKALSVYPEFDIAKQNLEVLKLK